MKFLRRMLISVFICTGVLSAATFVAVLLPWPALPPVFFVAGVIYADLTGRMFGGDRDAQ